MTREELREIPELAKQIARHEDRLYYLEQKAICVPAIEPKEKVQTSVVDHGNREADMAIDLTREIEEERRYLTEKQDEAERFFRGFDFDYDERTLLKCRYIWCMTWSQIADSMHADERNTRRKHGGLMDRMFGPWEEHEA